MFYHTAVLLAYGSWLSGNICTLIWLAAMATVIFRSELSILFGLIILQEVTRRRVTIGAVLKYGIPAGLVSLGMCNVLCMQFLRQLASGITVAVDSYYWKRWLWPEGEVLWYNTYENKSSQWGVSLVCYEVLGQLSANILASNSKIIYQMLADVLPNNFLYSICVSMFS